MPFSIEFSVLAFDELRSIKPYYRQQILEAIEEQLLHQPTVETRNRKQLSEIETDFPMQPPLWQLRVGSYRVFYDVEESEMLVVVRAIREKPPHKSTENVT
jgi:mRNA-degrading endonuclease RelE of RelBE toxin-antitoxin system